MEIARPLYLWGALAALAVLPLAYLLARRNRNRALARLVSPFQAKRLASTEGRYAHLARLLLATFGVALCFVALARPRWGTRLEVVTRKGVDIIVALDTSFSMLAEDVAPNRLEMAKRTVSDLIDRLEGDRIGIVAFAGDAYVACPLTLDEGAAKMFLADVGPFSVSEPGTAIGTAIRKAVRAFGRKEQKYKVLILMTDGEDLRTDPLGAAKEAKEEGVVIHALGFGTGAGAPIPVKEGQALQDYKKDQKGNVHVSRLDEAVLAAVAAETGGAYYRATPSQREIDTLFEALAAMDKTDLSQKLYALKEERFQWPLAAGLLLLLAEAMVRAFGRRRLPPVAAAALLLLALPAAGPAAPLPLTGAAVDVEEGNRLVAEGKLEEALSAYAKARAHAPDAPQIPYDVGNVLYKQQKFDEAVREYGKAAGSSEPAISAVALYNQGNAHFRAGRLQEAVQAYAETLRRNPSDRDAKWNYELARRRLEEQKQEQEKQDQEQKEDEKNDEKNDEKQESQEQKGDEKKDENEQKQDQEEQKDQGKDEKESQPEKPEEKQSDAGQKEEQAPEDPKGSEGKQEPREASREQGQEGNQGSAATGELSKEEAEKVLDAFLQAEREAKQQAEMKRMQARRRAKAMEDW